MRKCLLMFPYPVHLMDAQNTTSYSALSFTEEGAMSRKLMPLFAGIALLVSTIPGLANEKLKSKYRTITGCLSKPEGGD